MRPKYGEDALIDLALKVVASISAQSDLNSARVMSLVQHLALAGEVALAGTKGSEHLAASSGRARMSVVYWRSQLECLHTSSRSEVKLTSHSMMPAKVVSSLFPASHFYETCQLPF